MRDCPRCGDPISDRAVACNGCGWAPAGTSRVAADPMHFLCSHEELGERCASFGTLAQSTHGGGPWYCQQHYPAFRGMRAMRREK